MCKEAISKGAASKSLSVLLPVIAALFHFSVFTAAVRSLHLAFRSSISTEEFQQGVFTLDRAIFMAYMFDLVCCFLGVIPFSRCHSSGDIIGHHLPTLILALPLALSLWFPGLQYMEPAAFAILALDRENKVRRNLISMFLLCSGLAYLSSLNEVFMCFQRAEMSWQSKRKFKEIPEMKFRLFSSRLVIGIELCFKFFVFWGISLLACIACCNYDKSFYDFLTTEQDQPLSSLEIVWKIYSSPSVLRAVLYRVFSVVMYPSMGARALKKIKEWVREGRTQHQKVL